jgi:hypothetical protein
MNIHLEKSYRLKRMFFKQIILIFNFCLLSISAHSIAFVEPKISPFANSLINQLCQNYVSEIHKTFDDIVELCEDIPVLGKGNIPNNNKDKKGKHMWQLYKKMKMTS